MISGEEKLVFVRVWALVGPLNPSGWPHTHGQQRLDLAGHDKIDQKGNKVGRTWQGRIREGLGR